MKKILLIHGPNLNLLGARAAHHYGCLTLVQLEEFVAGQAKKFGARIITFQSNHEGALIDFIQKNRSKVAGIIINPGALAHYGYALHDALVDSELPCVEVHLSAVKQREPWRRHSVTKSACIKMIQGKKEKGYSEALSVLKKYEDKNNKKRH